MTSSSFKYFKLHYLKKEGLKILVILINFKSKVKILFFFIYLDFLSKYFKIIMNLFNVKFLIIIIKIIMIIIIIMYLLYFKANSI